jgi:IS5 family transposase
MREAQVSLAIRWFCGYGLHEVLPHHSSLTRIRQRWGVEGFRRVFERTVRACLATKIAKVEIGDVDASLIRADVSWRAWSPAILRQWRRPTRPRMRRWRAGQAALAQPQQKLAPARAPLSAGEIDREHLAPALPVDAEPKQHGGCG